MYWVSTALISVMMVFSGFSYLTNEEIKTAFAHIGFPGFFRIELGAAKILGALTLMIPFMPARIKQFAYFGFVVTFVSAFVAHVSIGDTPAHSAMPLAFLVILGVSYFYHEKLVAAAKLGG